MGLGRGRAERGNKESTWEPREHAAKMTVLSRNKRSWGKGREAQGLERLRVGGGACHPG